MQDDDQLDVIEIDKDLCDLLRQRFGQYRNVHVHCISITQWKPSYSYDFIVSALPFTAFDPDFVMTILNHYKNIIKNNGLISYFAYVWMAHIKKIFTWGEAKIKHVKNMEIMSQFRQSFQFARDLIFLNIPPANVYHLRMKKSQ